MNFLKYNRILDKAPTDEEHAQSSISIQLDGEDFTLQGGENLLFTEKEYQASYDGPWFTGVDEFLAIWFNTMHKEETHV